MTTQLTRERPKDTKTKPWIAKWMKDEDFWKDVAANTTAGVFIIIITAIIALASGIWNVPDVRNAILIGFVLFGGIILTFGLMFVATVYIKPKRFTPKKGVEAFWTVVHITSIMGLMLGYTFGANALGQWIAKLP